MLDSGVTNSLVRNGVVRRLSLDADKESSITIVGLAGSSVKTPETINLPVSYCNVEMPFEFDIVKDRGVDYSLILGVDFLMSHKIILDSAKRRIAKEKDDGSNINIYLDEQNDIEQIVNENIPVYLSNDVVIKGSKTLHIPVNIDIPSIAAKRDLNFFHVG